MRILVTGGAGFLGLHICEQLTRNNDQIIIFDLASPSKDFLKEYPVEHFKGDVTSFESVMECLEKKKVDGIINAAARILGDQEYPLETFRVNVSGVANVLEGARRSGVKKAPRLSSTGLRTSAW